jgi:hypothetical protein
MALVMCSCELKQKETINNYVAYLTEDDYTITKVEKLGVITTYDGYMEELKSVKEWSKDIQNHWVEFLSKYPSYTYNDKTTIEIIQRIESAIDVEFNCDIEMTIASKDYFSPIHHYRCEYLHKGMKNTIYLFLQESFDDSYKVQLLGEHFFNLKP